MSIKTIAWSKVKPSQTYSDGTYCGDYLITVKHWQLFDRWRKPCLRTYEGGSTVWHDASDGERCPLMMEVALGQQEWLIEHGKLNHLEQKEGT